ncbi:hypothetical protein ZIOFF_026648 [Zingiber officinale]|uniref:Uncharacterized protein n=1 Tax=Zingiber officinale TaxID=94328 RepID=A0A8J5LFY1_ZINOF|nr:hypothetical protein ZIOFF_026648 [Zingiber officinale]
MEKGHRIQDMKQGNENGNAHETAIFEECASTTYRELKAFLSQESHDTLFLCKACSAYWSSSIRGPSNAVSFPIQNPTNFAFESKMVSKVEESRVRKQGKEQKQEVMRLHKVCKFKRSSFSEEEDATCSAMLLLACVVCDPSSI